MEQELLEPVAPPPCWIVGLPVHPLRLGELLAMLRGAIARHERLTVFYANVHAANLAQHDAAFQAAYKQADLVFCDGQGLRLGARLLGHRLPERFTPPDWIDKLAALCAAQGERLFLLGGRPGVAERAATRLSGRHPGLSIAVHHGFFLASPEAEVEALTAINRFRPGVLLVGLGMPIQERWVAERRAELHVPVVVTVGALFDYLGETVRRGPRWLTDNGFEWLCRLYFEPRRLWRRYLLGNPTFLLRVLHQWLREHGGRERQP